MHDLIVLGRWLDIDGWIKLHRTLLSNWVFYDALTLKVWLYILLKCTHKEIKIKDRGELIDLIPGQIIFGRKRWSQELKIDEHKLYRIIKALEDDEMITLFSTKRRTIITVCNWHDYQTFFVKNEKSAHQNAHENEQQNAHESAQQNAQQDSLKNEAVTQNHEQQNTQQNEQQNAQEMHNRTTQYKNDKNDNNINNNIVHFTNAPNKKDKNKDIDDFFEKCWKLYPLRKGKGRVKPADKKAVYKLGDEIIRAIGRYKQYIENQRSTGFNQSYQNGNTFFHKGYIDYLDENYVPYKPEPKTVPNNQGSKPNKFHNFEQRTDKYTAEQLDEIARRNFEKKAEELGLEG